MEDDRGTVVEEDDEVKDAAALAEVGRGGGFFSSIIFHDRTDFALSLPKSDEGEKSCVLELYPMSDTVDDDALPLLVFLFDIG